ncbi:MAG: hypothetical protein DHS20C18_19340 [Saprospiraceae bacterium]|nr:MAG: hypothetical protein DHS20C18_19340 [Saprospiraceae bacterium]
MNELAINIIPIIISTFAIILSLLSLIISYRRLKTDKKRLENTSKSSQEALNMAKEANFLAVKATDNIMASSEKKLRAMLNNAISEITNAAIDLEDFKKSRPNEDSSLRKKVLNAKIEAWLNIYENACNLYLTGNVNRERFKKNYKSEIENLIKNSKIRKNYFDPFSSKYENILSVFKEWNPPN